MSETKTPPHSALAAALAAFQADIPSVVKGATATVQTKAGGSYKYSYADLAVINPLVLPKLALHGLSWTAKPTLMGPEFVLMYKLMHESGEAEEGVYPLPDPGSLTAQELGSAITYARRYALCAVTGIAPGGDDDDAGSMNDKAKASGRTRQQRREEPVDMVASQDWAADILAAETVDQLRAVNELVEKSAELGRVFAPESGAAIGELVQRYGLGTVLKSTKVGELIGMVRDAMRARDAEAAAGGTSEPESDRPAELTEDWETASIPNGDGS